MKILVVNTVPTEKNGITNVIFNYLEALNSQSIQMDVVMINEADYTYKEIVKKNGGKYHVIIRSNAKIPSYFLKLCRIIHSEKYDVVHIHGNSHSMVLELLAAKIGGCKARIVHSHNTTCNSVFIHRLLTPLFNSLYTHALACGEEAGKWQYGNSRPFTVLNNGVYTDRFCYNEDNRISIRRKLGLLERDILIGNVGHFWGEVKNQSFVVAIFNELYQKDSRYKLCLIGDGSFRSTIKQQVENLGLQSKVFFTGNIDNVNEYLNAFDLILMPSLYEGLPLTLIEQQANGLQCVCSDVITKEVDKTGNLLFISLKQSAEDWAKEVSCFVNLDNRPVRSKEAIENIKKAGYSINNEALKLFYFYKSISKK